MEKRELEALWTHTLGSATPRKEQFERLAEGAADVYAGGDPFFKQHIHNRLKQIHRRRDIQVEDGFDLEAARTLVADEIGFDSWEGLLDEVENHNATRKPLLFEYAIAAMVRGDFSALESMVGGREKFHQQIVDWCEKGYFAEEQETLAEVFSAACMLGHARTTRYLLDKGVDPYAGMKTGLSGFHYAASSGRLDVIKLLIERSVPMEVKNMYDGTVFAQAIWSAVNEYTPDHAEIVERLIDAGAVVEPGYLQWWEKQSVPSAETKERIARALLDAERAN